MSRIDRAILRFLLILVVAAAPAVFAADVKLHVDDTTVARGEQLAGAAAFLARLDQPLPKGATVTLDWETVDGTAVQKVDYIANKGSVTMNASDGKMKVLAVVPLITGKGVAQKCAFAIKVKARISGDHTITVDNREGKATATIYKDTTPVARRAN